MGYLRIASVDARRIYFVFSQKLTKIFNHSSAYNGLIEDSENNPRNDIELLLLYTYVTKMYRESFLAETCRPLTFVYCCEYSTYFWNHWMDIILGYLFSKIVRNELAPGVSPVVYKPLERCVNRLSRCIVLNDLDQLPPIPPQCALK